MRPCRTHALKKDSASLRCFLFSSGGSIFSAAQPKEKKPEKAKPDYLSIGQEGIVNNNRDPKDFQNNIVLGKTEADATIYIKTLLIQDKEGFAEMAIAGKVFWVPNCTEVRKIGTNGILGGLAEVRVTDQKSDFYGEAGWTAYENALKQ